MNHSALPVLASVIAPPVADGNVHVAANSAEPLQEAQQVWRAMLEGFPQPAWLVALHDQCVVAANQSAARFFGQSCEALCGTSALSLATSPEDLAWWAAAAQGHTDALYSDTVVSAANGRVMHATRSIRTLPDSAGNGLRHALITLTDCSAAQLADEARETLLCELQATLEATADGILVTDLSGHVRAFNRRFAELWSLPMALLVQRDDVAVHAWMARSVVDGDGYETRMRALQQSVLVSASDRLVLHSGKVLERVSQPLMQGGGPQGRVWSYRDLSANLAAQQQIETLTHHDTLTGLPNRSTLGELLNQALATMPVSGSSDTAAFALLVVDLDRFRQVNDSLGQVTGDRVLLEVTQRIRACLRDEDMLARLGADQFAVLLQAGDSASVDACARRILKVVAEPCQLADVQFTLTCSIGIALAPSHGRDADDLVRHAEAAMREAKAAGRAGYRLHQKRAEVDRRWHMRLDHAMRQALVSGRFRLHYQPQVSIQGGQIVGAEALLRWRDPELGEMPPGRFIPVAEESGFIVPIGDWVLGQAVRQGTLWHQRGHAVPIAVNVSALQFQQPHFVEKLASLLALSGLPPRLLELELTESILVHDVDDAMLRLHALARLGVHLSIDDFGTGYSSLSYLKRFPIGKLKVDRSFVSGLPENGSDASIVRAILQMAKALGMKAVAEGVETEGQRAFLLNAGCDEFQGFLFAPALDAVSFEQRLLAPHAQVDHPALLDKPTHIRLVRP